MMPCQLPYSAALPNTEGNASAGQVEKSLNAESRKPPQLISRPIVKDLSS